MSVVRSLEITRYTRDGQPYTTETVLEPTWERLALEISTMHRFEKPILWLLQHPDVPDADVLTICGGEGAYFIQVGTAESDWLTASRPDDSNEPVEVWTSDQGFTTVVRFTWALEPTLEIVRWYFEHGEALPSVVWE